ncbi:FecR domain-containing protein [Draconibacterium sp. IB214405]|uniref:FecR family protein n=1 Tax=Draconibacterium sp. IB214405 TaxID=3097352 RepID=UPI002A144BDB|nr:FecR domain-containing protein [Draconibacterium sp. IB214405]MDX8337799.1 FecR domain-containing protein [Draconibacterium sp. IB214405]
MENIEKFDWELVTKYLNKETNSQENEEVETWLSQADKNREEFEQYKKMLNKVDSFYQAKKFDNEAAWNYVHAQLNPAKVRSIQLQKTRKEVIAQFYKYAAIVIIALLLGSVTYYLGFRNPDRAYYSEVISAENQVLNEYVLPDGSVVTLNNNSKLLFPKKFKGDTREVTIIGEAFFDVQRNPEKPFVINAGSAQVKVLGTSFNVSAYPGAETVEVIVKTGKVQVINNNATTEKGNEEVFLTPGEKGTLVVSNSHITKTMNSDPNFLSWKTHDLVFNTVPLNQVVECLEKAYHIDIDVMEPELNDLLYEGHFDQKPVDFVLDVIRLTFDLELSVDGKHYTLTSRTNKQ